MIITASTTPFGTTSEHPTHQKPLVTWSSKPLSWSNFRGQAPKHKGMRCTQAQCTIKMRLDHWDDGIPKYELKAILYTSESWSCTKDSAALKHAQLHFDTFELYTRKLRKRFETLYNNTEKNPVTYYKAYREFLSIAVLKNMEYDHQVCFNPKKQLAWKNAMHLQLRGLSAYAYTLDS